MTCEMEGGRGSCNLLHTHTPHPVLAPHLSRQPPTEDYSLVYAPPEYIEGMNCDTLTALTPKADVFSFAKV